MNDLHDLCQEVLPVRDGGDSVGLRRARPPLARQARHLCHQPWDRGGEDKQIYSSYVKSWIFAFFYIPWIWMDPFPRVWRVWCTWCTWWAGSSASGRSWTCAPGTWPRSGRLPGRYSSPRFRSVRWDILRVVHVKTMRRIISYSPRIGFWSFHFTAGVTCGQCAQREQRSRHQPAGRGQDPQSLHKPGGLQVAPALGNIDWIMNFCTANRKWSEKTLMERPEVDTKDLDTFSLTMFRWGWWHNQSQYLQLVSSRLQLRVLKLFNAPVLGPALRLAANKLMQLNIFLATDWEQWILQVSQVSHGRVSILTWKTHGLRNFSKHARAPSFLLHFVPSPHDSHARISRGLVSQSRTRCWLCSRPSSSFPWWCSAASRGPPSRSSTFTNMRLCWESQYSQSQCHLWISFEKHRISYSAVGTNKCFKILICSYQADQRNIWILRRSYNLTYVFRTSDQKDLWTRIRKARSGASQMSRRVERERNLDNPWLWGRRLKLVCVVCYCIGLLSSPSHNPPS